MKTRSLFHLFFLLNNFTSILYAQQNLKKNIPNKNIVNFNLPQNAIPFEFVHQIYLKCKFDNKTNAQLIFDTKADGLRMDSSFLKENNIKTFDGTETIYQDKVYQPGAGGKMLVRFCKNVIINLDTIVFNKDLVPVLPLNKLLGPALGHRADGIIGSDLFDNYIMEINFEHYYIILHQFELIDKQLFSGYTKMPYKDGLKIKIGLNDSLYIEENFGIDIGMAATLAINSNTIKKNNLTNNISPLSFYKSNRDIGGGTEEYNYRANYIKIDTFIFNKPIISLDKNVKKTIGDTINASLGKWKEAGLVGNGLFSRFNIIMDFKHNFIYLKPNGNFKKPFGYTTTGFFVDDRRTDLNAYEISFILQNSPANFEGLRVGDLITEINGKSVRNISFVNMIEILQNTTQTIVRLKLKRNNKIINITIKRRKFL